MGVRDPRDVTRKRRQQVMRLKVRALLKERKEGGNTAPAQPAEKQG